MVVMRWPAMKFGTPTVANGEVFVGTTNSLVTYGLTPAPDESAHRARKSAGRFWHVGEPRLDRSSRTPISPPDTSSGKIPRTT